MESIHLMLGVVIWFVCLILILLILVQGGTGDVGSTFGGGGQLDSTLGVGASQKMGKITGWLSVIFLVCVLVLAIPLDGGYRSLAAAAAAEEAKRDEGLVPALSDAVEADEVTEEELEAAFQDLVEAEDGVDETAAEIEHDDEHAAPVDEEPTEPGPGSTGELDLD